MPDDKHPGSADAIPIQRSKKAKARESKTAPTTRWRQALDGRMECVDLTTGEVVERSKAPRKSIERQIKRALNSRLPNQQGGAQGVPGKVDEAGMIWIRNADGVRFQVPCGFNPEDLPCKPRTIWVFNPVTCDQIIELVMAGHSVTQIGHMPGFPPSTTILKWTSTYKEFGCEVDRARRLRAHSYHDRVMQIAEDTSKETAIEDRLKIEAFKWGASVGDPDSFGTRIKHAGDVNSPIGFLIDTGVPINDEDQEAIEVTSTEIPEALPIGPDRVCLPDPLSQDEEEDLAWPDDAPGDPA